MTTKVLIVDDHPAVRQGARAMCSTMDELEIVAEARDGHDAIEKARIHKPDLILMDIRMPHKNGLRATREITDTMPETSVLMYTSHEDDDYLLEAIENGAAGYLLKDANLDEFQQIVTATLHGESAIPPHLMSRTLARLAQKRSTPRLNPHQGKTTAFHAVSPLDCLTPPEREALFWMARGLTNPEIAEQMYVAESTAKGYAERIIKKLSVGNRVQATRKAIEYGIFDQKTSA